MQRGGQIVLEPGQTIGILGGGQLGRMLSQAASRLGLKTHIYAPSIECPAAHISSQFTEGAYDDAESVIAFARQCDAVTYEFENIPSVTAKAASSASPLRPGARALDVSQDRLSEKTFLRDRVGVEVAGFVEVNSVHDLRRAVKILGIPAVLKTRRFGYDGKGQFIIRGEGDIAAAWEKLAPAPCILEAFIPFSREVSVIAARAQDGDFKAYPLIENVHQNHILHTSSAPTTDDTGEAQIIASKILGQLDYVGVMGVEFFQMADGKLVVNEVAPRVHNSGHWTQNAGCTDQFEQHIRAVAGWPLGDTNPKHGVVMTNLIGEDATTWQTLAQAPNTHIHLYGKSDIRTGRKMGHINTIIES